MSTSHHGPDNEAQQRILDEIFGRAKLRWPQGQVDPTDHGETAFAVAVDPQANIIRVHFTKPMAWIGFDKASAIRFRDMLTEKIDQLP